MIYKIYAGNPGEEQLMQMITSEDLVKAKEYFCSLVRKYRSLRSFIMYDYDLHFVMAEMQG